MKFIQKIKREWAAREHGYTLLFAVLISALVLGVGVSILNIARKELLLNSSARESQYAFYAADTGYECAVYWDTVQNAFSTSSPASSITCGTTSAGATTTSAVTLPVNPPLNGPYVYSFSVPIVGNACAFVTLTKTYGTTILPSGSSITGWSTNLLSRGYNVGYKSSTGDCSAVSSIKVERALYATY